MNFYCFSFIIGLGDQYPRSQPIHHSPAANPREIYETAREAACAYAHGQLSSVDLRSPASCAAVLLFAVSWAHHCSIIEDRYVVNDENEHFVTVLRCQEGRNYGIVKLK